MRFPEGWERPTEGSYSSDEEFVVLEGALRMSGSTYRGGDWVFVPAGAGRIETKAPLGATTLASFSGPARWYPGNPPSAEGVHTSRTEPQGEPVPSPLRTRGWILRRGDPVSSWLIEPPEPGSPCPVDTEIFEIESKRFAWIPKGEPIPRFAGTCFCRTFHSPNPREDR